MHSRQDIHHHWFCDHWIMKRSSRQHNFTAHSIVITNHFPLSFIIMKTIIMNNHHHENPFPAVSSRYILSHLTVTNASWLNNNIIMDTLSFTTITNGGQTFQFPPPIESILSTWTKSLQSYHFTTMLVPFNSLYITSINTIIFSNILQI